MKVAIVVVVVLALVGLMAVPTKAITCGQVAGDLAPCVNYLRNGGVPSSQCCTGIRNLVSQASTTADRQTACNCAKEAAAADKAIKDGYASSVASKCGVQISYPISPSTDCNKVT